MSTAIATQAPPPGQAAPPTPNASGASAPEAYPPPNASGASAPEASGRSLDDLRAYLRAEGVGLPEASVSDPTGQPGQPGAAPGGQPPPGQPGAASGQPGQPGAAPGQPQGQAAGQGEVFLVELPDAAHLERLAVSQSKVDPAVLLPRQLADMGNQLKSQIEQVASRQGPMIPTEGLTPEQIDGLRKAKSRKEILEILARAEIQGPPQPTMEQAIARGVAQVLVALGIDPNQLEQQAQAQPQQAQPAATVEADAAKVKAGKSSFSTHVKGNAAKYPLLSALPQEMQEAAAWDLCGKIGELSAAEIASGKPITYDLNQISDAQIARALERSLASRSASGQPPAPHGASPATGAPAPNGAPPALPPPNGAPPPYAAPSLPPAPYGAPPPGVTGNPAPYGAPPAAPGLSQAAPSGTAPTTSVTAAHVSQVQRREPQTNGEFIRSVAAELRQMGAGT